jgi:hypothetical protein
MCLLSREFRRVMFGVPRGEVKTWWTRAGQAGVFFDSSTSGPSEWGCVASSGCGCGFPFPLTRNVALLIAQARPLFAWDGLEDGPSLQTIRELLAALPDGPLLASPHAAKAPSAS